MRPLAWKRGTVNTAYIIPLRIHDMVVLVRGSHPLFALADPMLYTRHCEAFRNVQSSVLTFKFRALNVLKL